MKFNRILFNIFFFKLNIYVLATSRNEISSLERNQTLKAVRANRNITLMIISTSTLSVLSSLPRNLYVLYRYLTSTKNNLLFTYLTSLLLIISCSCNILLYFSFNRLFRKVLSEYVSTIFCRKKTIN